MTKVFIVITEGTGDGRYRKLIELVTFDAQKAEDFKTELRNTKKFDQVYISENVVE